MVEIVLPDNKQHWLELRSKVITSTESPALFGMSPYCTEFELHHRKKDGDLGEIPDNKRMEWGRRMERVIAEAAYDELEYSLANDFGIVDKFIYDPASRMGSSFDYKYYDAGSQSIVLLECKNVDWLAFKNGWTDEEAPEHIELQLQHQLHMYYKAYGGGENPCINVQGNIACLVGGNDLRLYFREYDREVGEAIEKRIKKFWQDVESGNEPNPVYKRDADFIIKMHGDASDNELNMIENDKFDSLMASYDRLKSEAKEFEKRANVVKAKALELIGDAGKVYGNDWKLTASRTKDTEGTLITEKMVGQRIGAKKGYRQFRLSKLKGA